MMFERRKRSLRAPEKRGGVSGGDEMAGVFILHYLISVFAVFPGAETFDVTGRTKLGRKPGRGSHQKDKVST